MPTPEDRIASLGLSLPAPARLPEGMTLPFPFINVRGDRAVISGHPMQAADGAIAGPYGVVGRDLTTQEAREAAVGVALSVLSNLKAEIGELGRVRGWVRVMGLVNSAEGYAEQHLVMHGFSETILAAFGLEVGRHARSAIGTAGLPMNFALEVEGEVILDGEIA